MSSINPNLTVKNLNADQKLKLQLRNRVSGGLARKLEDLINPDPVEWIEEHFLIPETPDNKIVLGGYQKACLREILRKDSEGNYPYSIIIWSDTKKSIKSCVAAAVLLWMAWQTPWGSLKIVANDLKQADSRVAYYVRRAITLHPLMRELANIRMYNVTLPNHCRIEAVPVDPKGEAGGNDDMVVYSELWAANSKAAQQMWTETTLSPTKMGKSFRWVETYAGFIGASPLLEQLYGAGVKGGEKVDFASDFEPELNAYINKPARMFCLWNEVPRMPWQTPEYYAQEEAVLQTSEFMRVHRNQWVTSQNAFVPPEWWYACKDDDMPEISFDETPCVIAIDAAVSGDTFGVVMLSGRGDGTHADVRYSRCWKPPKSGKIDFSEPEAEIRRLVSTYNIVEISYDPFQLEDMAARLRNELIVHLHAFSQTSERAIADKRLQDMIRERRVAYRGDEEDLTEHILNSDIQTTIDENRMRIVKRASYLKIDLAVCLSMAANRLEYWVI